MVCVFTDCRKLETSLDLGYEYFPLNSNKYWVYSMDSVVYDGFTGKSDTFHYEIMERIDTSYLDLEGDLSYQVSHYYRSYNYTPWHYYRTSILKRTTYTAEQFSDDKRIVKLNFPIKDFKSWDENAYNTDDYNLVRIRNLGIAKSYGPYTFSSTFEVDQGNEQDFFLHNYGLEVYAKGVGLVRKEYIKTETQNDKKSGSSYIKTLIETNWP